jgi:hypothetical protein
MNIRRLHSNICTCMQLAASTLMDLTKDQGLLKKLRDKQVTRSHFNDGIKACV